MGKCKEFISWTTEVMFFFALPELRIHSVLTSSKGTTLLFLLVQHALIINIFSVSMIRIFIYRFSFFERIKNMNILMHSLLPFGS